MGQSQATEYILQAVSEVTNAEMRKLAFDKTIKALIIDDSEASRGIYKVSQIGAEKTNIFKACSENTTYKKDECVYITIPEGNASSGNKIIIGRYVDESETYYNYVNPMDSYLDITGNLIDALNKKQFDLTANYDPVSDIVIWETSEQTLRGYDRMALKGEFKTWLSNLDINSGTYGLELIIEDNMGKFIIYKLTSREMYGNPYAFETFYTQEILLDISSIEEIKGMRLRFVQENDFYMSDGTRASGLGEDDARAPSNIFLKAPYISVGYDISDFEGDDLRIYTEDEQTFNSQEPSEPRTIKANWIHASEGRSAVIIDDIAEMPRNPDLDTTTSGAELFPSPATKADLVWFEYKVDYPGSHFAAGQGWVEIEDENSINNFTYSFNTPAGEETDGEANSLPYVKYKAMIITPSLRYVNFAFTSTDQYKAIEENKSKDYEDIYNECINIFHEIMRGDKTYSDGKTLIDGKYKGITCDDYTNFNTALNAYLNARSEIKWVDSGELTFPNTGYAPGKYAEGAIANVRISVDPEHLRGKYLIYDDAGFIIDASETSMPRYCEVFYDTIAGIVNQEGTTASDIAYHVDETEMITWYIPLDNTMIAVPVKGQEYYDGDTVVEDYVVPMGSVEDNIPAGRYCKISRVPQFEETTIDEELLLAEHHMYSRQFFKIKDYYTQLETNNKIHCRITKEGKNWYADGVLEFGIAGTNGTDSTFILKMYEVNSDGSRSNIETSALSLNTTYYEVDKDNNTISLTEPKEGKVVLVPKLYDYNRQEVVDYFSNDKITYKFYPGEDSRSPFTLSAIHDDGSITIGWNSAAPDFSLSSFSSKYDYYLVIEAETPYKITYNFLTYTDTDDPNDPTYLSPELRELGKKVGDYILDDNGQKKPELDRDGNPITRDDYLKTYLPISIVKNKIQKYKVVPPNPTEASAVAGGEETETSTPDTGAYLKHIVGANRVIYDRNGSNAKFYKDPYKLYNEDLEEVENIVWSENIKAVNDAQEHEKATIKAFYPIVTAASTLQPLEMYILSEDLMPHFCVQGKKDNEIVCIQPVLIIQNKYGSTMLNKWDGSLTIDEKNGTILASMVGAGIKDKNNTFSGVLMGEVQQAYKDNHNGIGLYGFNQSDQSFGFNINGTAFIGKAGHGRIWFDGNNGTITSGTYSDGIDEKYRDVYTKLIRPQQGMQIDLDGKDGISSSIHAFGPNGGFVVDLGQQTATGGIDTPVTFKLFTGKYKTSERGMIYFDPSGQYIQSTNYDGFYDTAKTIAPTGLNTQTQPPGWVEAGGSLPAHSPASTGMFIDLGNGWIDARKGIVGGWQLGKNSLMTPRQEIILWAGDSKASSVNGRLGQTPNIQIGTMIGTAMQGNFWIADYKVSAQTGGTGITGMSAPASTSGILVEESIEGLSDKIDALSYSIVTPSDQTFTATNGVNEWFITDDSSSYTSASIGLKIQTAIASGSNIIALTPNTSNNKGLLGTKNSSWDSSFIKKLFIYDEFTAFKGGSEAGWYYVATQPWVTNVIVPLIQARMKQINSIYWSKTQHLLEGLGKLTGVGDIKFTESGEKVEITAQKYTITPKPKAWGVDVTGPEDGNKQDVASVNHGHALTFSQGTLKLTAKVVAGDQEVATFTADNIPCSTGSGGNVAAAVQDLCQLIDELDARIKTLETFKDNHSHSGFLTGLPSHSHSGTDSAGNTVTVT